MNFVNRQVERKLASQFPDLYFGDAAPSGRKWPIRYDYIEVFAILADIVTIVLASFCSAVFYQIGEGMPLGAGQVLGSAALVSTLLVLFLKCQGLYKPMELLALRRQAQRMVAAWISICLLLSAIVFALKIGSELSRGVSLLFAGIGLVALLGNRMIVRELLSKGLREHRFSGRNVVLITDPQNAYEPALGQTLAAIGFQVKGHFTLPPPSAGYNIRKGLTANVIEHIHGSDIEEVVVAADPNRWSELRALAAELRVLPFPITFVPLGAISEVFRRPRRDLGDTICVELQRGPLTAMEHSAKRCIDVIGAGLALLVIAPLLIAVAIAVRMDSPGPILFRQQRLGFNGRSFWIYKFRTMSVLEDGFSAVQARADDDRVTAVGRWLRRTSIDELPQLFNVLDGSMSLVGPRPHAVAHDNQFDKLVRNYAFRRRVRPGLTGWAQIHGCRGPTPTTSLIERRVDYDLWYIDNWSLRLDLSILLQTPLEVLRGRNAY